MQGRGPLVGAMLVLATAGTASAQGAVIFFGGGATFPVSLYKDEDGAKTGWMAQAGVGVPVGGKGFMIGGELLYGSNKHEAPAGDKTNLYGANGFLLYRFGNQEKPGVFIAATAGAMKHDYRSTAFPDEQGGNFEFAWGGGAGLDVPFGGGGKAFYVEGRYLQRGDTRFVMASVGLSFAVGAKK